MVKLRAYSKSDAETIVRWISDEKMFYLWSAGRHGAYPPTPAAINRTYAGSDTDNDFFPFTAYDETGIVGHMIMRYPDSTDRTKLRFGYIIVDSAKRGKGYGAKMLREALRLAFEQYAVEQVSLGVFRDNTPASLCYLSVGFHVPTEGELPAQEREMIQNEEWIVCNLVMNREDYYKSRTQ